MGALGKRKVIFLRFKWCIKIYVNDKLMHISLGVVCLFILFVLFFCLFVLAFLLLLFVVVFCRVFFKYLSDTKLYTKS